MSETKNYKKFKEMLKE